MPASVVRASLLALAAGISLTARAAHAQRDVLVGPMLGIGSSSFGNEATQGRQVDRGTSWAAGAFVVYSLHDNISIEPQLYFNRKAATLADGIPAPCRFLPRTWISTTSRCPS